MLNKKRILVIGGGFYGMYLADYLARKGNHVFLYEKENDFMQRASYINQARVHNGYHYPRSILTALRSRISFPRFVKEFQDCIDESFSKYYMIAGLLSKISALQFKKFCHRIGAVCEPAPAHIEAMVNPELVEGIFRTIEYAFNARKLRDQMVARIEDSRVNYYLNHTVKNIYKKDLTIEADIHSSIDTAYKETIKADHVFNCTYSMLNQFSNFNNDYLIPVKHEITEIALSEVPDELKNIGITIMDGPFFSVMPFPARKLHSFTHVRYTPHCDWNDQARGEYRSPHEYLKLNRKKSSWQHMIHDAQRYIPMLKESRYVESLWEIKTILQRSEMNDSRPILFKANWGIQGYHCIMGGKIDNIYDIVDHIESTGIINGF